MGQRGLSLLKLTFLGTSAAQPTIDRNLSGLAVKADADLLLFDCGEGSQRQMLRFGTGFGVSAVFFTHFHADHYLGIIGFLRTLGMMGRQEELTLYGPPPAARLLPAAIYLGTETLAFPVHVRELSPGEQVKRGGYTVTAVEGDHSLRAFGYVLDEEDRPGLFDLPKARALGVPEGPAFGLLQRGQPVRLADGREIAPGDVLGPARRGRRLAISGDTRPTAAFSHASSEADVVIHEATFSDDEQVRAFATKHSTAREAARVAREAGAARLYLTHLSSRHDRDPGKLLREASTEFDAALEVAHDGLTFELPPSTAPVRTPPE